MQSRCYHYLLLHYRIVQSLQGTSHCSSIEGEFYAYIFGCFPLQFASQQDCTILRCFLPGLLVLQIWAYIIFSVLHYSRDLFVQQFFHFTFRACLDHDVGSNTARCINISSPVLASLTLPGILLLLHHGVHVRVVL